MKVAMIGLRGIPAKSGGVEVVVENLAPELVKLGCEVTVYARTQYCNKNIKEYKGVKIRYMPTINTKYTEAIVHTFLSTIDCIFRDFDIVHYHAMGNALFSLDPRFFGKKTIVTLHGLDYEREKWGFFAKTYLKLCERLITFYPNKIISVSEKIKKHFKDNYNKDIHYIPNAVNIEKPKKLDKLKRFGIKKDNYILFLSRIVPEKGLDYLIPAFKKTNADVKLLIVGDATHTDDYFEKIKQLASNDKRIIFTGPLYGEEKAEAFTNALFFVLPSTIEGMPVVVLEAMSFGKCPLVSNIQENKDLVKEKYGITFKSKDTDDLKEKIEYMIRNKGKVKKIGIENKKMVKKKYNWEEIAKKTLEVYK